LQSIGNLVPTEPVQQQNLKLQLDNSIGTDGAILICDDP